MTWLPKGSMQKGIIEKFADQLKEGAILTHACTIPTTKFNDIFQELGANVNVTSYHPGAVPEMKGQVYIAEGYADETPQSKQHPLKNTSVLRWHLLHGQFDFEYGDSTSVSGNQHSSQEQRDFHLRYVPYLQYSQ